LYLLVGRRLVAVSLLVLGAGVWRTFVAAAAMASALYLTGLGWGLSRFSAFSTLSMAVPFGATVHVAVLLLLWRTIGKQDGPEAKLIELVAGTLKNRAAPTMRRPS
jgi:hypothetical protein